MSTLAKLHCQNGQKRRMSANARIHVIMPPVPKDAAKVPRDIVAKVTRDIAIERLVKMTAKAAADIAKRARIQTRKRVRVQTVKRLCGAL